MTTAARWAPFAQGLFWGFCLWWAYLAWGVLTILTGAWRDMSRLVPRTDSKLWFWWGAAIGLGATIALFVFYIFPAATAPGGAS